MSMLGLPPISLGEHNAPNRQVNSPPPKLLNMEFHKDQIWPPILFLLFINDLPNAIVHSDLVQFADDTTVYCSDTSENTIYSQVQADIDNVIAWFNHNRVTVNNDKCMTITFGTRQNLWSRTDTPSQYMLGGASDGDAVHRTDSCKLLGVMLDKNMDYNHHCSQLCKKLLFKYKLFKRLRSFIPENIMISMYNTLVQPTIDYGLCVWGYAPRCQLNKVQRIQGKFARLLTNNFDYVNARSADLLSTLHIPTIDQRRDYFTAIEMYTILNGKSPAVLQDYFTKVLHAVNTRRTHDPLLLDHCTFNTEFFKRSFIFNGTVIWNLLPFNLRTRPTLALFKTMYKCLVFK